MLTYSHLSSSKISEKSLMWVLRTRWLRFSAQFRIKMSHDWTKNILWKYSRLLPFLTSISLTLYRISKNLYSRFCKKGMFWAPFGVKTVHVWEETFFLNIHHCHLSFFLYHLKDFKKNPLLWISQERCRTFWAQFGVQMSYFGAKRSFFRIFTTVIFVNL